MGFSATGTLLTDILIFTYSKNTDKSVDTEVESKRPMLNKLGYLPVVSTITGLGRILLGVIHTIVHLVCSLFSQERQHHLEEASRGAKNIARGLVEIIPIIGNITLFVFDTSRINKFGKMALEKVHNNPDYYNYYALFDRDKEISKKPYKAVRDELDKLGRKQTSDDYEKIIRKQ